MPSSFIKEAIARVGETETGIPGSLRLPYVWKGQAIALAYSGGGSYSNRGKHYVEESLSPRRIGDFGAISETLYRACPEVEEDIGPRIRSLVSDMPKTKAAFEAILAEAADLDREIAARLPEWQAAVTAWQEAGRARQAARQAKRQTEARYEAARPLVLKALNVASQELRDGSEALAMVRQALKAVLGTEEA